MFEDILLYKCVNALNVYKFKFNVVDETFLFIHLSKCAWRVLEKEVLRVLWSVQTACECVRCERGWCVMCKVWARMVCNVWGVSEGGFDTKQWRRAQPRWICNYSLYKSGWSSNLRRVVWNYNFLGSQKQKTQKAPRHLYNLFQRVSACV